MKTSKLVFCVLATMFAPVLTMGVICFVQWSVSFAEWTKDARGFAAFFSLLAASGAFIFTNPNN